MELKKILVGLEGLKAKGSLDVKVKKIEINSKNIAEGDMFIAIKGYETDGHKYIDDAIQNGAKVIMIEDGFDLKKLKLTEDITLIVTADTRYSASICACNFYGNPSKKLKVIGITGTKGKTTTSFMIKSILENQGKKVGLIGTIAIYIGDKKITDSDRTTPDSIELQKTLAQMVKEDVEVVIMEVSSQSLKLDRVTGTEFYIGAFTNFSKDHISEKEHPDMDDYFDSKLKLFTMCKNGFLNADNVHCMKAKKVITDCEVKTYGIDNNCDLLAKDITITNQTVDFKVKIGQRNERIKVGIPGRFSIYNTLLAIAISQKFGGTADDIRNSLLEIKVPGRSEVVPNKRELPIMIDYAHSPDSLQNILSAVKTYTRGRVILVFGCGGDRDTSKRAVMGEIAGKTAQYTIITSDNPRTEEPKKIVEQVEEGIKKTNGKYICIVDRTEAIKHAIEIANKNDLILLCGKGHETYQEINGEKHPYDERDIIEKVIDELEKQPKPSKKKKKK